MTLPFERSRALLDAKKFLLELTDSKLTPRVPKHIRQQARHILRHYPTISDIALIENGWNSDIVRQLSECPFATKDSLLGDLTKS